MRRKLLNFGADALSLAAEDPSERMREFRVFQVDAPSCDGTEDLSSEPLERGFQVGDLLDRQREVPAHARAQDFGGPGIRAGAIQYDGGNAEGRGRSQDGADIAGVLHPFEEDVIAPAGPGRRDLDFRRDALRCLGVDDCTQDAVGELDRLRAGPPDELVDFRFPGFADQQANRLEPRLRRRGYEVGALDQNPALPSAKTTVLRKPRPALDACVVARADQEERSSLMAWQILR